MRAALATTLFTALVTAPVAAQHFDGAGWDRLFDGTSLQGWTTTGGRYDGAARWSVEDGAIVGRQGEGHAGGLLYTDGVYDSFVFRCEVKLTWPFDSGVFVRMVPPPGGKGAQVTLDARPDGEVGAVYSDGFLQHNADGMARWRREEWNRVEVLCAGHPLRLQAWLNGEPLTDFVLDDEQGFAPRGRIGLQVHGGGADGGEARFRDVFVRELPPFDPATFEVDRRGLLQPTAAGREAGWRDLLAGDLAAWEAAGGDSGYGMQDGELVLHTAGEARYLRTREEFTDFELQLDFKIAPMANSGVFLRADPAGGNPSSSGCELQILDDFDWERVTGDELEPWQHTASLYHSVPSQPAAWRRPGAWNTMLVRFQGPQLRVVLNGREQYDVDTHRVPTHGWPPFAERAATGFIGLQRHAPKQVEGDSYAWFRNVMIRRLDDAKEAR